ncbi:MAG: hypothetical protein G01um1014107_277 [Parcubacteria group bacterium Gr01-1014_107]|nr:MAG: hypothetical protein G01um1014107_277 [Parcubacteria group bacterium Gr01-1014_107]
MAHRSYLEEIDRKAKRSQAYWLLLIASVLLAVISLLVIIRRENELFVEFQKFKNQPLSDEERERIEKRLLPGWAKQDLALKEREKIEQRLLNGQSAVLSDSQRRDIEQKLNK